MRSHFSPVAIVGVSALFPGSSSSGEFNGADGFWRDILAGRDLITDVPANRWLIEDHYDPDPRAEDKTYCRRGGFLSEVAFDPVEFGVPPSGVKATDTSQLLALIVAKKVLDDALNGQFTEAARERASVILGVTSGQELIVEASSRLQRPVWVKALRESGIPEDQVVEICDRIANSYTPWQENTFPGLLGNVIAGRIANRFDLGGSNFVTDAACASSLSALSMACSELHLGHSDLVIAGGVDTFNDITMFVCFSKTPALSPTGDCRPFSNRADGTILGEGLAMFALKRLEDAEREGNRIYAVVRGIGSSSDGRSKSIYAPLAAGQARALRRAYEQAGYGPETVELVEAHGTGTVAGDAAEFESLNSVFAPAGKGRRQWCALGSVKSQVGHTKAAAGAAGMFKAVMALHARVLPPTLKVELPNPALEFKNSPFYLNTEARPWVRGKGDHPRRASLSSFGFGGTNFHVAFEEYRGAAQEPPLTWTPSTELVLLAASSVEELSRLCATMAVDCASKTLAALSLRSQSSFDSTAAHRLAIVAENSGDLAGKLHTATQSLKGPDPKFPPAIYHGTGTATGRIAFLFPGQGSQYPGMTADLAMLFPEAREVWDQCPDLAKTVFPAPAFHQAAREAQKSSLTATEIAQPAIGMASASILGVLRKLGLKPDGVAGHSFGEIPALYAAGAFDGDTMAAIARKRGEFMMQSAAVPAGMLAVTLDAATLTDWIDEWQLPVVIANQNTPRQSVLSGELGPLAAAERKISERGVQSKMLEVATGFHSPVVAPAAAAFLDYLASCAIEKPQIPFYPNSGGEPLSECLPDSLRDALAAQIALPVRFVDLVTRMYSDGFRTFIEIGPGSTLTSFVRTILDGQPHRAIATDRAGQNGVTTLWHALGSLAASGVALDWKRLRAGYRIDSSVDAATQRFTMSIQGGNYGRPYPPAGGASALPKPVTTAQQPQAEKKAPGGAAEAYRVFQETIASAHRTWQEHLAKGHADVVRALESAYFATLGQTPPHVPSPVSIPALSFNAPPAVSLPPQVALASMAVAPAPMPGKSSATGSRELLWSVIAEKTGYPVEMLEAGMALEADLGIDSIKRVEIFSSLQERMPGSLEFEPAAIAELRTLGDIVSRLEALDIRPAVVGSAPEASSFESDRQLVLSLISEKTGYPVEMLNPEMALEADLGIDSIKRVEIFSALQDRRPDVPEDTAGMARLRTIADVIGFMKSATGGAAPAPQPSPVPKCAIEDLRFHVVQRDAPASGHNMLDVTDGQIAILDSAGRIGASLARRLTESGYAAHLVPEVPDGCRGVIFLAGLKHSLSEDEALACNREAFLAARAISGSPALFVTVQDTGGNFHPENRARAWSGGVAGLARTAALEWPACRVKAVDIDTFNREPEEIAETLAQELIAGGAEIDVGLNAWGHRITLITEPVKATGGNLELAPNAFVVATGGARGITAACLLDFTRKKPLRLLILGRTSLREEPAFCAGCHDQVSLTRAFLEDARARGGSLEHASLASKSAHVLAAREVRANIVALEATGSEVRYECADINDAVLLTAVIDSARQAWGPVLGIVHGAGVLADKRIEDLTAEQFGSVFKTKADGLRRLLDATSHDPLAFIALFSSIAARCGNPGQSAYSSANEALNRAAHAESQRRMSATKVKALNWGPWDAGMVTPALKRLFEERGVRMLGLEQGARLFTEELLNGMSEDVEVVLGAMPLGSPSPSNVALRVVIKRDTHPHLDSHRIQDVPVFPVVGALDLFLRATLAQRNGDGAFLSNLRVLRGIRLEGFENGGDPLTVRSSSNGAFEIVNDTGTRHYEVSLHHDQDGRRAEQIDQLGQLSSVQWTNEDIYGRFLFHGPAFRVIESVDGVSDSGIAGVIAGAGARGWADPHRSCDAAMLDGGLQLARLWGFHKLGRPSLPMSIGSIHILEPEDAPDVVRCEVHARASQSSRFVCQIAWRSFDGRLLATMREVGMYLMPEDE